MTFFHIEFLSIFDDFRAPHSDVNENVRKSYAVSRQNLIQEKNYFAEKLKPSQKQNK